MSVSTKFRRLAPLSRFDNRIQLFINRLLWPSQGPNFYRKSGMNILVDHQAGDQDGTRSCLVPGLYDPIFAKLGDMSPSPNIIDLGANGGGFLLALRQHKYEIQQCVAVELNPHTWSRLVFNIYRNFWEAPRRFRLLNGAASNCDGEMSIRLGQGSVSDSSKVGEDNQSLERFQLPTYTLESLIKMFPEGSSIDLCKVDIEGAEFELFESLSKEALSRIDRIVIEIHDDSGGQSRGDLRSKIKDLGFREVTPDTEMIEDNVFFYVNTRA